MKSRVFSKTTPTPSARMSWTAHWMTTRTKMRSLRPSWRRPSSACDMLRTLQLWNATWRQPSGCCRRSRITTVTTTRARRASRRSTPLLLRRMSGAIGKVCARASASSSRPPTRRMACRLRRRSPQTNPRLKVMPKVKQGMVETKVRPKVRPATKARRLTTRLKVKTAKGRPALLRQRRVARMLKATMPSPSPLRTWRFGQPATGQSTE
mmetsp:Transcript_94852/g.230530  ORF Transcript_94852/g.230530 Transcript_94852/m.230530 type:complete len:209 (+) Transcript_94852:439-1065(+)